MTACTPIATSNCHCFVQHFQLECKFVFKITLRHLYLMVNDNKLCLHLTKKYINAKNSTIKITLAHFCILCWRITGHILQPVHPQYYNYTTILNIKWLHVLYLASLPSELSGLLIIKSCRNCCSAMLLIKWIVPGWTEKTLAYKPHPNNYKNDHLEPEKRKKEGRRRAKVAEGDK